jgi:hypothetical protein
VNNDFGLANKADNPRLTLTLGAEERICFVHLSDEVRPASLNPINGFSQNIHHSFSFLLEVFLK